MGPDEEFPEDGPVTDETCASLETLVARLHAELAATEELPVERDASRWIGEAQAVAGDAASPGLEAGVRRERVARVRELLANVGATGHEEADARVERARAVAASVLEHE